ncbi:MAG: DUF2066 domain-containing protein [Gammaproteobacteria bacterium]
MSRYIQSITLLLCLLPLCADAIKIPGLYQVEVPIADQSGENRQLAIQTALRLVLVKLTGDRYAPERTALAPVLEQAGDYVQQYRYKEAKRKDTDLPGQDISGLTLWVRFDEETLNGALRGLSVPVWGKERPSTLIWLVVQDASGRRLLSMDSESDYISVIDRRARQRGIVLIFPLLDLEDTSRLRPSDIWGGFKGPVIAASRRYQVDSILTGSLEALAPGIWEGHWAAYIKEQTITWVTRGDLPDMALDEGVDGMSDILAAQFAHSGGLVQITDVNIAVADIFNVDQYARALNYLESLNSVTDVQVKRVEPGKVTFSLSAHGGELAITQAIALGRVLQPITAGNAYRLLP